MPDASPHLPSHPLDWSEAFAALPQEAPPAHAWNQVAARLDRRRRGRLVPAWIGVAAAAALVAVALWPHPPTPGAAPAPVVEALPNPVVGATKVANQEPVPGREPQVDEPPIAAVAAPTTRVASKPVERGHTRLAAVTIPAAEPDMARLYRESAQLEALLAAARDQRMGSAGAMLLADALDDQVAGIDAALSAAPLDPARRESLWQARVDLLRQAVGFESTQRLVASRGDPAMLLVSVD